MRPVRSAILSLLSFFALSVPCLAQTAVVAENPPWSSKAPDHPGFCIEVINEMAKVLKTKVNYEFLPWPEAQQKVIAGRDLMIFPLARVPEREPKYLWIQKLFNIHVVFATAPGKPAIDSFDAAKALPRVAVLQGTPWATELANNGFTNVKVYTSTPAIVAAIMSGEVAAAYSTSIELDYVRRIGGYKDAMVYGKELHTLDQYLSASKDSPSIAVKDWQDAFEVLQQEGTFDRIYISYFGAK
jgi:polar amino acid transport system substrate-binding protein